MNDTQRLDSLALHGLCIAQMADRINGEWVYRWICHFGIEQSVEAPTIREVLDKAVSVIEGEGHAEHRNGQIE